MIKERFYSLWTTGRGLYCLLFFLTIGIFVLPIIIIQGHFSDILVEVVFALVLLAGVFATPCSFGIRLATFILASSAVGTRILHKLYSSDFLIVSLDNILASMTLIAFTILLIKHFLVDKAALRYRIVASVAVYLIFGVLWARLYETVYLLNPAAFSLNEPMTPFSLIYFSFVTLVTLGYGDIVPLSMVARSLAILEGVVGQLYLVIMISTLVSEFSALAVIPNTSKSDLV